MSIFFSPSERGFYNDAINLIIPGDAIEIEPEYHAYLMDGQSQGKVIVFNGNEKPILADPPPMSIEEVKAAAYAERDSKLTLAGLRISPLQDAVDLEEATASEVALLKKWKQYRVALNRIDQQEGFPENIDWPVAPE